MADALRALVRMYETGDDRDRIAYDIAWVSDQRSTVDTMNGFIEVYLDVRGAKGAWEGVVCCVDREKTRRIEALAAHAASFEAHMPWDARFRKVEVQGVTARAMDVVIETGDAGPITPIGVNLPNDQAIRKVYGSKSMMLTNVNDAYERSTPDAMRVEFAWTSEEADRARRWGGFAQELSTSLHEAALRAAVVRRVDALDLPSYTAFVMPRLSARCDARGAIVDVEISYPCDLETQMLEYSAFSRHDVLAPTALEH